METDLKVQLSPLDVETLVCFLTDEIHRLQRRIAFPVTGDDEIALTEKRIELRRLSDLRLRLEDHIDAHTLKYGVEP